MPITRTKRRVILAAIGAGSGLLSGAGASIVLTQGGHMDVNAVYAVPLAGVLVGAGVGLLDLSRAWSRVFSVAIVLVTLLVGVFGFADPAEAQGACDISVGLGGDPQSLGATTASDPLRIDLSTTNQIEFVAMAPGVSSGTVEVAVQSAEPFSFAVDPGETVVYFDRIEGERASAQLQVEKTGATGFAVIGPGYRSPMMPLGVVQLSIVVNDIGSGTAERVCDDQAWIRVVAQPVSNPVGLFGLGLSLSGLVGFAFVNALRERWRPTPPPPVIPTPLPEPPALVEEPQPPSVPAGSPKAFIPQGGGPHAEYVETRILDAGGKQIDVNSGLLADRRYRLEVTLHPAVSTEEAADAEPFEVTVAGDSTGIAVTPALQIGVGALSLPFELPIVPRRRGRQEIVIDVTAKGHLLQTERIGVSVVDDEANLATTAGQTTRTVYSGSDMSPSDLNRRKPRSLLIILERQSDGTVDARIRNPEGKLIAQYDSNLQPAALATAAAAMRTQLLTVLEAGPGRLHHTARGRLEEELVPLVKAGRQMHLALFPRKTVSKEDAAEVARRVTSEAVVQVAQFGAGLGYSTLPWHLVYDHAFLPHTQRNRLCPDFPDHDIDDCPHRDDPEVFCPTGFWGYRAIIEEPLAAVDMDLPVSTYTAEGDVAVGYFEASLTDSERQSEVAQGLGVRRAEGYDQMLQILRAQASRIGFVYFYAHHGRDDDIGTPGISMGAELLSSLTLAELGVVWPNRPLVFVNGCGSGDYSLTDPLSLLDEFRSLGAAGVIATECTMWDPLAGRLGEQIMQALANGEQIGPILRDLRRSLLGEHNNPVGFAYRLHAMSETTVRFGERPPDIAIDLTSTTAEKEKQM